MTLLCAAGRQLCKALSDRVADTLPSLNVVLASSPDELARAIEARPFEVIVVAAELLRGVDAERRRLLAESEILLVADQPRESIGLAADDFAIADSDPEALVEELVVRIATSLHRLDRRLFSRLPSPVALRRVLSEAAAMASPSSLERGATASSGAGVSPADSPARHRNFDLESFATSYGDSPEIMHEILRIYVDEAPQRLESMRSGLAERDFVRVSKAAHSLANTSGTLGSAVAVGAARRLEESARRSDYESALAAADELASVVEVMLSEVSQAIAEGA